MHHYEIIIMINPDQNVDQVLSKVNYYKKFILKHNGLIHRYEDWGRRQLAYPINKLHKAYYVLMNIELQSNLIIQLKKKFSFDNIILRHLIITVKNKILNISPILKLKDDKKIS